MVDKRTLFLVLALFSLASAYTVTYDVAQEDQVPSSSHRLVGRNKCTYGPSYWCFNLTQASSCKATGHCISKVWSTLRLAPDNDDVCKVCKDMVQQARDQLLSNMTQEELKEVLEGSCNLIPLKVIAKECCSLMDNFLPELVDALASRMDPQVVCAISGLCSSTRIDGLLEDAEKLMTCPSCNYYMGGVFSYFKNDEEALKDALLDQCGYLGSYSDACRAAVLDEWENIRKAVEQPQGGNQFCQLVGICGENENPPGLIPYTPPKEDLSCDFCKQLVTYLKTWITSNMTKEEFTQVVENLCKETGKYQAECLDFFKQYGKEIYELIVNDLDPQLFCERVGVCEPKKGLKGGPIWTIVPLPEIDQEETVPLTPLAPGERLTGNDERNAINHDLRTSVKCQICEYAMLQLQEYIDSPNTTKNVEAFIDQLCDKYLPKEMSSQCQEFVTDYGDQLLELVGEEVDPKEICPLLKLCPVPQLKDVLPTCALCEFTLTKLINMIGKNKTSEAIERAMDRVCHHIPAKYYNDCETFMHEYGDRVIEMILIDGSSHEICAALHLCLFSTPPSSSGPPPLPDTLYMPSALVLGGAPEEESVGDDDPKCVLCEYVITTLATKIKDNATEEEIKTEVEQVCTYLPKTVRAKCKTFIESYGDLIISYLAQEMDPQEVCTELKLCKNKKPPRVPPTLNLNRCEMCGVVKDYFEMKMENPEFQEDVIGFGVKRLCGMLGNVKAECTEIIEDYGPYLLQLLRLNEDQICEKIDLCPPSPTPTPA